MTLLQIAYAPNRHAYDSVAEILGAGRPPGRLVHAAAELPDGRIQIVDVFESQEALDTFGEVIMGAFAKAGLLEQMMEAGPPVPCETFEFDKA